MDAETKQALAELRKEQKDLLKMIKNHEVRIRHMQIQLQRVKSK